MKIISLFFNLLLSLLLVVAAIYICLLFDQGKELENQKKNCENQLDLQISQNISIGSINISRINLSEEFFPANGDISCIEKSICDVKTGKSKYSYFLAAHSNDSTYGFFKNINKLKKGDIVEIISNDSDSSSVLEYTLKSISLEQKSKYRLSDVKISDNTLILITDDKKSPNDSYLILKFELTKFSPFVDSGNTSDTNTMTEITPKDGF